MDDTEAKYILLDDTGANYGLLNKTKANFNNWHDNPVDNTHIDDTGANNNILADIEVITFVGMIF